MEFAREREIVEVTFKREGMEIGSVQRYARWMFVFPPHPRPRLGGGQEFELVVDYVSLVMFDHFGRPKDIAVKSGICLRHTFVVCTLHEGHFHIATSFVNT